MYIIVIHVNEPADRSYTAKKKKKKNTATVSLANILYSCNTLEGIIKIILPTTTTTTTRLLQHCIMSSFNETTPD